MCPFLLVDRLGNSKGFNSDRIIIHKVPANPACAHFDHRFIGGGMRCCAASGAGGGRKICALMTGEVAEPFRWLCSTGCMPKVFPRLNLPCFSDVLGRTTVGRYAGKSAACAELWGLIFLCRVKVHTVKGVSMAKLVGPS